MQGFKEYHGVAWYRLKFNASKISDGDNARIYFGGIDGNAEIYLNGKKIGEHLLSVDYEGWNKEFGVKADSAIKQGENILAVKVTSKNATSGSGIFKGVAFYIGTPRAK
jgi:beta-glucuronidase